MADDSQNPNAAPTGADTGAEQAAAAPLVPDLSNLPIGQPDLSSESANQYALPQTSLPRAPNPGTYHVPTADLLGVKPVIPPGPGEKPQTTEVQVGQDQVPRVIPSIGAQTPFGAERAQQPPDVQTMMDDAVHAARVLGETIPSAELNPQLVTATVMSQPIGQVGGIPQQIRGVWFKGETIEQAQARLRESYTRAQTIGQAYGLAKAVAGYTGTFSNIPGPVRELEQTAEQEAPGVEIIGNAAEFLAAFAPSSLPTQLFTGTERVVSRVVAASTRGRVASNAVRMGKELAGAEAVRAIPPDLFKAFDAAVEKSKALVMDNGTVLVGAGADKDALPTLIQAGQKLGDAIRSASGDDTLKIAVQISKKAPIGEGAERIGRIVGGGVAVAPFSAPEAADKLSEGNVLGAVGALGKGFGEGMLFTAGIEGGLKVAGPALGGALKAVLNPRRFRSSLTEATDRVLGDILPTTRARVVGEPAKDTSFLAGDPIPDPPPVGPTATQIRTSMSESGSGVQDHPFTPHDLASVDGPTRVLAADDLASGQTMPAGMIVAGKPEALDDLSLAAHPVYQQDGRLLAATLDGQNKQQWVDVTDSLLGLRLNSDAEWTFVPDPAAPAAYRLAPKAEGGAERLIADVEATAQREPQRRAILRRLRPDADPDDSAAILRSDVDRYPAGNPRIAAVYQQRLDRLAEGLRRNRQHVDDVAPAIAGDDATVVEIARLRKQMLRDHYRQMADLEAARKSMERGARPPTDMPLARPLTDAEWEMLRGKAQEAVQVPEGGTPGVSLEPEVNALEVPPSVPVGMGEPKAPHEMTFSEFDAERPTVEGYQYHGSPEGDLNQPAFDRAENNQEGSGFYTTDTRDKATGYSQGRTVHGKEAKTAARERGRVNYVRGNATGALDMDAPVDRGLWERIATRGGDYLDVPEQSVETNHDAYMDLMLQLREARWSGAEAADAMNDWLGAEGIRVTTHLEGKKSGKLHRVTVWREGSDVQIVPPREVHRQAVEAALREGRRVPDEVLAEYPDIQRPTGSRNAPTLEPDLSEVTPDSFLPEDLKGTIDWTPVTGPARAAAEPPAGPPDLRQEALENLGRSGYRREHFTALPDDRSRADHLIARAQGFFEQDVPAHAQQSRLDRLRPRFNADGSVAGPSYAKGWKPDPVLRSEIEQAFDEAQTRLKTTQEARAKVTTKTELSNDEWDALTTELLDNIDSQKALTPEQFAEYLDQSTPTRAFERFWREYGRRYRGASAPTQEQMQQLGEYVKDLQLSTLNDNAGLYQRRLLQAIGGKDPNGLWNAVGNAWLNFRMFGNTLENWLANKTVRPDLMVGSRQRLTTPRGWKDFTQSGDIDKDFWWTLKQASDTLQQEFRDIFENHRGIWDLLEQNPTTASGQNLRALVKNALDTGVPPEMLAEEFRVTKGQARSLGLPEGQRIATTADIVKWVRELQTSLIDRAEGSLRMRANDEAGALQSVMLASRQYAQQTAQEVLDGLPATGSTADQAALQPFVESLTTLDNDALRALLTDGRAGLKPLEDVSPDLTAHLDQWLRMDAAVQKLRGRIAEIEAGKLRRENYSPQVLMEKFFGQDLDSEFWDPYSEYARVSDKVKNAHLQRRVTSDLPALDLYQSLLLYIPTMLRTIHLEPALIKAQELMAQLPPQNIDYAKDLFKVARGQLSPANEFMQKLLAGEMLARGIDPGSLRAKVTVGSSNVLGSIQRGVNPLIFMGMINPTGLALLNALEHVWTPIQIGAQGPIAAAEAAGELPFDALRSIFTPFQHMHNAYLRRWGGGAVETTPEQIRGVAEVFGDRPATLVARMKNRALYGKESLGVNDNVISPMFNMMYWLQRTTDIHQRETAFRAFMRRAMRVPDMQPDEARRWAKYMVDVTFSDYGKMSQAPSLTQGWGPTWAQLKKYTLNKGDILFAEMLPAALQLKQDGIGEAMRGMLALPYKQRLKNFIFGPNRTAAALSMGVPGEAHPVLRGVQAAAGAGMLAGGWGMSEYEPLPGVDPQTQQYIADVLMLLGAGGLGSAALTSKNMRRTVPPRPPGQLIRGLGERVLQKGGVADAEGAAPTNLRRYLTEVGEKPADVQRMAAEFQFPERPPGWFSPGEQEAYTRYMQQVTGYWGEQLPDYAITAARKKLLSTAAGISSLFFLAPKIGLTPQQVLPLMSNLVPPTISTLGDLVKLANYELATPRDDLTPWQDKERRKLKKDMLTRLIPGGWMTREWRRRQDQAAIASGPENSKMWFQLQSDRLGNHAVRSFIEDTVSALKENPTTPIWMPPTPQAQQNKVKQP